MHAADLVALGKLFPISANFRECARNCAGKMNDKKKRKGKKKTIIREFSRLLISKMIKNLIRLDEFFVVYFCFGNCSINNRGSWIGKKIFFFFWGKLNRLYETRVIVTRSEKNFVWKLIGFYWKLFVQLKKLRVYLDIGYFSLKI